ncbi:hypothetical protein [Hymenobacter pini]|uniref:hypothetical protein n=1 Tax=Hymenobacter pini TaxID=2880879 RepID=UPI001CF3FCF5|nr:hypothetical protein [Hymenobacter pini]MCA8829723.1 hypothetical protein [Hymenobacter pini]
MRQTYQLLCAIEQRHDYFQAPDTPAVRITPTAATTRHLQRAGLWVKPTANGLAILRDLNDPAAAWALPDFLFPLRFQLEPLRPDFAGFTVLPAPSEPRPAQGRRPIHYFQVRAAKGALVKLKAEKALLLPLTPATLTADTGQLPAARPAVRVLAVARGATVAAALPLDAAGRVLLDEAGRVALDVRREGGGRYQLRVAGTNALDFYADEQLYAAQAWGVLEIDQPALQMLPLTVQLCFTARAAHWCYQFRYRPPADKPWQQPDAELSVKATARTDDPTEPPAPPPIDFERVPPPPGVAAAFLSREPIVLRERPRYTCALRYARPEPRPRLSAGPPLSGSNQPGRLIALLPTPGPELLRPVPATWPSGAETGAVYAEIFVHL